MIDLVMVGSYGETAFVFFESGKGDLLIKNYKKKKINFYKKTPHNIPIGYYFVVYLITEKKN